MRHRSVTLSVSFRQTSIRNFVRKFPATDSPRFGNRLEEGSSNPTPTRIVIRKPVRRGRREPSVGGTSAALAVAARNVVQEPLLHESGQLPACLGVLCG